MFVLFRLIGWVCGALLLAVTLAEIVGTVLPHGPEIAYVTRPGGDAEIYRMDTRRLLSVNLTNTVYWYPGVPGAQDQAPAWSPDGEWIAFQSTRAGNDDIWIMDAYGANLHQLTTDKGMDMHPEWSPDGEWVVYQSWQADNYEIFLLNVAAAQRGEPPIQLTDNNASNRHPAFSPDGSRIIFASSMGSELDTFELFTMNLDGSDLVELNAAADDVNALHPSYSPDGRYIVFDGFRDGEISTISKMRTSGIRTPQRIIGQPQESANADGYLPSWSPDGAHLLYVSSRSRQNSEIFIVPVIDAFTLGEPRQLTFNPIMDIQPIMRP